MERKFLIKWIGVFLFMTTAALTGVSQTNGQTTANSKEACLDCHGPFDKLAAATASYVAASGEKITPHRYVPHDSKEAKGIPECSNCHQPHPLPPTARNLANAAKPDVHWCLMTCHHNNNFEPCKKCHK